ncbi:MAG: glycosyltransferase [Phycisphaerae bacterium]|nr:glycosyltransferase [Patescibacteria group bacterium]
MLNKPIPITQHLLDDDTVQLVSISCLTYNHERFISDAIEGFLMQKTTFPVKINIFEDCSSDNTANIIREYQAKYPSLFNVFFQAENTWRKPIREKALKPFYEAHNKAKYIALCEGDDYWTDPLKLQKQVDFLEQNEDYGLVYTEINRIDEKGDIIDRDFFKNEPAAFCQTFEDYLLHAPFRAPCTWLFRRKLYREITKRYVAADLPMLLDIIASSKIHFLNDTTTHYRILTKSASHFTNLSHTYAFMKGVFEIQMDYAQKYNVSKDIIEAIKIKHAFVSYNFAVAQHDINQIKIADKLLIDHPELSYKFKVIKLLSKTKFGRLLVRKRLIKRLGYLN